MHALPSFVSQPGTNFPYTPLDSIQNTSHPNVPPTPGFVHSLVQRKRRAERPSGLPNLGRSIPNLPLMHEGVRKDSTALEDILFLWENAAPHLGVDIPLGQWKLSRTDTNHRSFAVKLQQREMIALEYINL